MKKPSHIQLAIPKPCHEEWNAMTSAEQGRFCSHCQKQVIDFTSWSDSAIYDFFSKQTGSVCGRATNSQLNRTIQIPHQPHSKLYHWAIAAGLVLLFAQPVTAQTKKNPPLIHATKDQQDAQVMGEVALMTEVVGRVVDNRKQPMANVAVALMLGEKEVKSVYTDKDGQFSIKYAGSDTCDIVITASGYRKEIIKNIIATPDKVATINSMVLEPTQDINAAPIVKQYTLPLEENGIIMGIMVQPSRKKH